MIFETLQSHKKMILEELQTLIDHYMELDEETLMASISRILDMYRMHQELEENYIYLAVQTVPSFSPIVQKACQSHEEIQKIIDKTTMVHVDEPDLTFIKDVKQLKALLKKHFDLDEQMVFPSFRQQIPHETMERLERQFQETVHSQMGNLSEKPMKAA